MLQNKGTFKYIDKDKIVPWLEATMDNGYDKIDIDYLIELIDMGIWDWQQGSE